VKEREISVLSDSGGALPAKDSNVSQEGGDDAKWYAAYTMTRHEKRIAEQCERAGITHFLPLYALQKTWKNRVRVDLQLPLFPNYIFAQLSPGEHVPLLRMNGVVRMVSNATGLVPIPAADMEALRRVDRCKTFVPHAYVHPGDAVRIQHGPFEGLTGVVLRKSNGLRFVVTLDVIGKSVAVDLSAADLELCSPQHSALTHAQRVSA
jgi:transcription antitermination factor NusG